jgi:hypothetical protein
MIVITKKDIVDEKITIPKGTRGLVKAVRWGDKLGDMVVEFPQKALTLVNKENVEIVVEVLEKKKEYKIYGDN